MQQAYAAEDYSVQDGEGTFRNKELLGLNCGLNAIITPTGRSLTHLDFDGGLRILIWTDAF